eukprot:CAMPEP_0116064334 /NCGR_PEP_ID=MMETSP0322-20121206/9030_1 /TAXON_ID=163516 /ORGANISM="Leptocylindrus danicus var. apora, Strain B651" /LENGTH=419 /DNA_ID=CAMNT_0003550287 /DNA_START=270 /DNA_END=1529 /DNA_ORIENTATION=+
MSARRSSLDIVNGNGMMDTKVTYEQHSAMKKAHRSTNRSPDRVTYDSDFSFRDQPYRFLSHQKGTIGRITLRLLQGRGLKRPRDDWSLMALGPMKHLPLSHKHGDVLSSFCTFQLVRESDEISKGLGDDILNGMCVYGKEYRSSQITNSIDPVWADNRAGSQFVIPLQKGSLMDGSPVCILARVFEPHTAIESMLPSQVKGGEPIGQATINLTDLVLGKESVKDCWVTLRPPNKSLDFACGDHRNEGFNSNNNGDNSGEIRLLFTYDPCGIEPNKNDVVCMEAFARKPTNLIVSHLCPMRVLERKGGYVLLKFRMVNGEFGTVRLHRNAVFVIEHFSAIDGAVNLALTPTDIFFSSKVGQHVGQAASPVVNALGDFVKPVMMTGQLATKLGVGGVTTAAKIVLASLGERDGDNKNYPTT